MLFWFGFSDVRSVLADTTGVGGYVLVYVFSMIPGIEPFIVIPVAIGLGLDPVLTGIAAFAGSLTAVAAIVLAYEQLTTWWENRTGSDVTDSSDRYSRARRVWNRYGIVGLSLGGPILAGIHLTALFAAVAGSDMRRDMSWLTVGLGVWTIGLVTGSLTGFSALGLL